MLRAYRYTWSGLACLSVLGGMKEAHSHSDFPRRLEVVPIMAASDLSCPSLLLEKVKTTCVE